MLHHKELAMFVTTYAVVCLFVYRILLVIQVVQQVVISTRLSRK